MITIFAVGDFGARYDDEVAFKRIFHLPRESERICYRCSSRESIHSVLYATILISKSATLFLDAKYTTEMVLRLQSSFKWWTLISVCLFRAATVSLFANDIAAVLSENKFVGGKQEESSTSKGLRA